MLGRLAIVQLQVAFAFAAALSAAAYSDARYEALERWVIENGGSVKTRIGTNAQGYRGLFTIEDAPKGSILATIPSACMLNTGSATGSFLTPALSLLRELKHPNSRLAPYLAVIPGPDEITTSCNMDVKYLPMLQSEDLTRQVTRWQDYLTYAWEGKANADLELTIPEVLGNMNITLAELKYACSVSASRYVELSVRRRLMMIPIYDMMNHKRNCPNTLSPYNDQDYVDVIAGSDLKAGDELCYGYGSMRDDHAVLHYGFLPDLEDPPRLLAVDHHEFNASQAHQHVGDEPFAGTDQEVAAEMRRLQAILDGLLALDRTEDTSSRLPHGQDWVQDMLLELQARRRNALRFEIKRLRGLLPDDGHTEL